MKDPVGTIHHSQLQPMGPHSQIAQEWETYRREVGRLLAEGRAGCFVLIKGDEIVDCFDTEEEAIAAGYRRFTRPPFLVQQVREYEPLYFSRLIYCHPWYQPCRT
jgi:hypothetical protein